MIYSIAYGYASYPYESIISRAFARLSISVVASEELKCRMCMRIDSISFALLNFTSFTKRGFETRNELIRLCTVSEAPIVCDVFHAVKYVQTDSTDPVTMYGSLPNLVAISLMFASTVASAQSTSFITTSARAPAAGNFCSETVMYCER